MPIHELKDQIARLPEQPGVYLYFNGDGDTIYVGKARALRDRVRSYLGARGSSPKTDALLDEVARLEVIVTDSVGEALALENNLIKQRAPRYNILLRDDKSYPYLQLTTNEGFPRVLVARRVERDGSVYAGPFLPAHFARRTMGLTHRLFGIRSCNEVITGKRERPCLEYDIKRCAAPCVDTVCSAEDYGRAVALTELFLGGRNAELIDRLSAQMRDAAAEERFEQAAQLRDAIRTVQTLQDRQQKMATAELEHRDVFGMKVGPAGVTVHVFQVRGGRVIERVELGTDEATVGSSEGEVLQAAVQQFYEGRPVPPEILVGAEPDEREALEEWLAARAGRRVHIAVPQRGEKRSLVDLVNRNAALAYQTRFTQAGASAFEALETLQRVLALPTRPRRIECFDISTIQGSETVASMVVCEDGRMRRSEYRKFRIKGGSVTPFSYGGGAPPPPRTDDDARPRIAMSSDSHGRRRPASSTGGGAPPWSATDTDTAPAAMRGPQPSEAADRASASVRAGGGAPAPVIDDARPRIAMSSDSHGRRRPASSTGGGAPPWSATDTDTAPAAMRGPQPSEAADRASASVRAGGGAPARVGNAAPAPVNNDFASMHEVVLRRYRQLLERGGPFPDLVVIDGGKGQLSAAYAALEELGLSNLVAVGLAKKEELVFTRDRDEPIAMARQEPALLLLQRIRDEAHRFAVTFHRQARRMRDLRSALDEVVGIGPRKRRTLLTTFGSVAGVRRATREELTAVVGRKAADAVLAFFASRT